MLNSLSSAVSGLDSFQQDMDVIGNNIANINTDGFKAGVVNFADSFSNTLQAASVDTSQIGTGVSIQAITNNWTQGAVTATGVSTDLAISGNGFFVVQDPVSGAQYVTQDGTFSVNASGYLVTAGGQQVMGTNNGSGSLSPIQINATGAPATAAAGATVSSYSIDSQGNINVTLSDGTAFTRAQVMLQELSRPPGPRQPERQSLFQHGQRRPRPVGARRPRFGRFGPD